jgi:hypothetical protein
VYGVLMSVCAYSLRHWDAPVPVVVVICFAPAFAVSGFMVARRHGGEQGVAAAVAATATGYGVVFLTAAGYAAVNGSGLAGLGWALFGAAFLPVALMLGVLCGCLGAAVAWSLRFLGGHGR